MSLTITIFYIFTTLSILSSVFVVFSRNPIFSVLFLIFSFFNVSCILFLFNFEFLPVSFLVIYVGAVGVLFLFVLMMLNIKLAELNNNNFSYLPLAFILGALFICELLFLSRFELNLLNLFHESALTFLSDYTNFWLINYEFLEFLGSFSNIKVISYALYTNYLYNFLLSGIILLLAMIAAIVLTLQKKFVTKSQNIYNQILRDFKVALVHYV